MCYISFVGCSFLALVAGCIGADTEQTKECSLPNEVYSTCVSPCDLSCQDLRSNTKRECRVLCVPGCGCAEGYVREAAGCVPAADCVSRCRDGSPEFSNPNCASPNDDSCPDGFHCQTGNKGNISSGICCPDEEIMCSTNEELQKCAGCDQTCTDILQNRTMPCDVECVESCRCVAGSARNWLGECVPIDTCEEHPCLSSSCKEGEQCVPVPAPRQCPTPPCDLFRCKPIKAEDGCKSSPCKEGEMCVLDPAQCEGLTITTCDRYHCEPYTKCYRKNEEYTGCQPCDHTCNALGLPNLCPTDCKLSPSRSCGCVPGFVRTDMWDCVRPDQCDPCTPTPCKAHEVCFPNRLVCTQPPCPQFICHASCEINAFFTKCTQPCDPSCEDIRSGTGIKCSEDQCHPGCKCNAGYVRTRDGVCVLRDHCKSRCKAGERELKGIFCGRGPTREDCPSGSHCEIGTTDESFAVCCSDSVCDQSPDSGPCKAAITRFYFDYTAGACEPFIFGGCKGNSNNFETKEDCEQNCAV